MTESRREFPLADLTTLRVGGPARQLVVADTTDELIHAVQAADHAGEPLLLIGGGSNLLISDAGFGGTAVKVSSRGIRAQVDGSTVTVTAAAGEPWDQFVEHTGVQGWSGLEALSGIPGSVGATPIQNVGAYGTDVAQVITEVVAWDRRDSRTVRFSGTECSFSYRNSRFKQTPQRWVVLEVEYRLACSTESAPIAYAELAARLGVDVGDRVESRRVRQAVIELRQGKGMVLDDDDHDSWSAGSFFTNPVVTPEVAGALPESAPRFPQSDGTVKLSAAWLIQQAGYGKGYGTPPATLSTKHVLALTNRGDATAAQLLALAREIRAGVERRWSITLENEPVIVGERLG